MAKDYLIEFIKNLKNRGLEMFGRYYSSYPAFVYDRNDPENRCRVRLVIPMITRDRPMATWALPKKFSGSGYGVQMIPKKGDIVWVSFRHGDRRYPLWEHGYEGTEDEKEDELKSPDNYWFKTPQGITGQFDDENREVRVYVPVTDNNTLKLIFNDTGISLVRDGKKISLGALNGSAEPAVLGDTLEDKFDEALDLMNDTITAILSITQPVSGAVTTGPLANAADFGIIAAQILVLKGQLSQFKSQNVTLD